MPKHLAIGETQMNFRIPIEKKDAFIKKAKDEGTSASQLLLNYIDDYLGIAQNNDYEDIQRRLIELEDFKKRVEVLLGLK